MGQRRGGGTTTAHDSVRGRLASTMSVYPLFLRIYENDSSGPRLKTGEVSVPRYPKAWRQNLWAATRGRERMRSKDLASCAVKTWHATTAGKPGYFAFQFSLLAGDGRSPRFGTCRTNHCDMTGVIRNAGIRVRTSGSSRAVVTPFGSIPTRPVNAIRPGGLSGSRCARFP